MAEINRSAQRGVGDRGLDRGPGGARHSTAARPAAAVALRNVSSASRCACAISRWRRSITSGGISAATEG